MICFPLIKVRDKGKKDSQDVFIAGSDHHHKLTLNKYGSIDFRNIQCCDGTGKYGGYEFVSKAGYWGKEIEFADINELLDIVKDKCNIAEIGLGEEFETIKADLCSLLKKAADLNEERDQEQVKKLLECINKAK